MVKFALHTLLVLLLCKLKGLADAVPLLDEFLLLVDEGVGVGKGIELSPRVSIVANRLVLQIRVLQK